MVVCVGSFEKTVWRTVDFDRCSKAVLSFLAAAMSILYACLKLKVAVRTLIN